MIQIREETVYRVTNYRVNLDLESICDMYIYRATEKLDPNLPLMSKQKFQFGLAYPDLASPKRNFCFDVNGRIGSSSSVTL